MLFVLNIDSWKLSLKEEKDLHEYLARFKIHYRIINTIKQII